MERQVRKAGRPPDRAKLHEAALAHLARFAATEAGLARVLGRRVDRWARAARAEALDPEVIAAGIASGRGAIPEVVEALRALGALNDPAFAESRAKRLARGGRSRRATLAHLAAKGVDQAVAAAAVEDDPARDLAAACIYLRRRRLPPFGAGEAMRAMAALARAGFDHETAAGALALDKAAAEALILAFRRGAAG